MTTLKALFTDLEYLLALIFTALLVILTWPMVAAASVALIPILIVLVCFAFLIELVHP
jgi:hypothetical protein